MWDMIKAGATMWEIVEDNPHRYMSNYRKIDQFLSHRDHLRNSGAWRGPPQVSVYVGPPGSDKSRSVRQICVEESLALYVVTKGTSSCWYNGLEASFAEKRFEALLFEDFDGWEDYDNILRITDGYHMQVQTKGGMIQLPHLKRIFFTSNWGPADWWPRTYLKEFEAKGTILAAFARRITEFKKFKVLGAQKSGGVILSPPLKKRKVSLVVSEEFVLPGWH